MTPPTSDPQGDCPQAVGNSALEQSFRDICEAHNLHAVNVGLLIPNDEDGAGWNVSLQRWKDGKVQGCWQSNGATIQQALTDALTQVPYTFALADEALPLGEAA